jgi:hypothetical protein
MGWDGMGWDGMGCDSLRANLYAMAKSNIAAPTGKRNPVIFIIAQLQ